MFHFNVDFERKKLDKFCVTSFYCEYIVAELSQQVNHNAHILFLVAYFKLNYAIIFS